jgi:glycosyltransferase involved in cell wall biosynthesis
MRSLPTVTIGMPAYNEEANIAFLLEDIFHQKEDGFVLEKIVVASDGSDDKTAQIVREFSDERIVFMDDGLRKGSAVRQNEIIEQCTSDVLVLLNADVALSGDDFLAQIVRPIIADRADLVSARVGIIQPSTLMERILEVSVRIKEAMFESINNGSTIYTCVGTARAFSHRMYTKFRFQGSVGEDAYSYLFCLSNKFMYAYAREAVVLIKLPDTFRDHMKQSERFFHSRERFYKYFGEAFVKKEYDLPKKNILIGIRSIKLKDLGYVGLYAIVVVMMRIKSFFGKSGGDLWEISKSSKVLRKS